MRGTQGPSALTPSALGPSRSTHLCDPAPCWPKPYRTLWGLDWSHACGEAHVSSSGDRPSTLDVCGRRGLSPPRVTRVTGLGILAYLLGGGSWEAGKREVEVTSVPGSKGSPQEVLRQRQGHSALQPGSPTPRLQGGLQELLSLREWSPGPWAGEQE